MSLLSKVTSGAKTGSHITVVYGPEKMGKSTFASTYPSPIFLDIEDGTRSLNVTRLTSKDLPSYTDLLKAIESLGSEKHDFKTVVIDSITALESMMTKQVCGAKYKDISDLPFGQGYVQLEDLVTDLMGTLRTIADKGIDVVLIGHTKTKNFTDAYDNSTYDRYVLQCHEKVASKIKSYSDNIFFLKKEVVTYKNDNGKSVASGDGETFIHTSWRPGAEAGTRLNLPYKIAASYSVIREAISNFKSKDVSLTEEIKVLLSKADEKTVSAVSVALEKAGNDIIQLERIKEKLLTLVKA